MKRFLGPFLILVIWGVSAFGQNAPGLPPRTGTVIERVMNLSFGDFTYAAGTDGSWVSVSTNGMRSTNGSVYLMNMGTPYNAAMFEFKLCPGRTITINYSTSVVLNGSAHAGGFTMGLSNLTFSIDGETITDSGSGYIKFTSHKGCNYIHRIFVGGKLNVGPVSANTSGPYHTDVTLTVTQE